MNELSQIQNFFEGYSSIKEIFVDNFVEQSHIYAIFDKDQNLIYVGQAQNVSYRFKQHQKNMPSAFSCKYVEVPKTEINDLEFILILKFLPRYNRSLPQKNSYLTLEEFQSHDARFYTQRVRVLRMIRDHQIENNNGFYERHSLIFISKLLDNEIYPDEIQGDDL